VEIQGLNGIKIRRILECGIGILPMFLEDHRLEADATMLILGPFRPDHFDVNPNFFNYFGLL